MIIEQLSAEHLTSMIKKKQMAMRQIELWRAELAEDYQKLYWEVTGLEMQIKHLSNQPRNRLTIYEESERPRKRSNCYVIKKIRRKVSQPRCR